MVAMMQIQEQRMDRGAERRARRHAFGWCRTEALATAGAAAPIKLDPAHMRTDRQNVHMVIASAAPLRLARDVHSAMGATVGEALDRLVWIARERPRHAGTTCTCSLLPRRVGLRATTRLILILRGGYAGILRRRLRLRQ